MKVDKQLKCKDCDWYRSCEYYHHRKETSQICKMFNNTWIFIEEFEKIKAEIEDMWIKSAKDLKTGEVIYENLCEHSEVLEIIDKHISELKGENNGKA